MLQKTLFNHYYYYYLLKMPKLWLTGSEILVVLIELSLLFIKFYLRSNTPYDGPLNDKQKINIGYLIEFLRCKIKFFSTHKL